MYESPDTPQPLWDFAVALAKSMTPNAGLRPTVEVGPFPKPLTSQQRNAVSVCWTTARLNGVDCDQIETDSHVHLIAYPEGR